jgi:uncharacterized membrane protein
MISKPNRLYFVDAMRAWAILMMLQGHFIDGLLGNTFRDSTNVFYTIWLYFRGITAPVFFTVSGFIFTYLLIKGDKIGFENPRVAKGIKRGLQLIFFGYLLRLNFWGLIFGHIYDSFYYVDVLHCIGFSILGIIFFYLITKNRKVLFPFLLITTTILLFIFEPNYKQWSYGILPDALANFLTKANGSVFTIFPWFGYATCGSFIAVLFNKYKNFKYLYPTAIITSISLGLTLIFQSSKIFLYLAQQTKFQVFADVFFNNYLFIRLGDVFLVFAIFMLVRKYLTNKTVLKIGQSTLSIYIIHYIILYGSFVGVGLYYFLNHTLNTTFAISGAILFIFLCTFFALKYEAHKITIKAYIHLSFKTILKEIAPWSFAVYRIYKLYLFKVKRYTLRLFRLVKD